MAELDCGAGGMESCPCVLHATRWVGTPCQLLRDLLQGLVPDARAEVHSGWRAV